MFHYGSLGSILENNLVKDLLEKPQSITQQTLSLEVEKEISPSFSADNNDELSLLDRKAGWLDDGLDLPLNSDTATFRCECAACCGEPRFAYDDTAFLAASALDILSPAASVSQNIIDGLLSGYQWSSNTTTITYSFYEDDVFNGNYYGPETGIKEVSEGIKSSVREILDLVETFLDLDFVEVEETDSSTFGKLRYMLSDDPGYAYAYLPSSSDRGGDVHLKSTYDNASNTNGFQSLPGKHGYTTLIHETFHALGLTHPHSGNTVMDETIDNLSTTVMTYDFRGSASPATAMPFDMAALQHLYGAAEHNSNDTTYVFGSYVDSFTVNSVFPINSSNRIKQTIWDSNGIDTLDFSNLSFQSSGYLFDLNEGGWLVAQNQIRVDANTGEKHYNYGTSLAYGMTIENVVGSISDDTIIANDVANTFSGYQPGTFFGNDILVGTNQMDTLDLSAYGTNDVTQTQSGNDLLIDLGSDGSIKVQDYYVASAAERLQVDITEVYQGIAIAEFGKVTSVNHNTQTIQLQNDYVNPVVFAQPLSYNGKDPAIIRITDVNADSDTISFYVQEAEYQNGLHAYESFSYMVVEAGTWQLEDGTLLEVGTVDSNKTAKFGNLSWENISFSQDFANTPAILSQVQTNNDTEFVRTRQRNADASGFSLSMEKEEALRNSGHGSETLGWLAIDSGAGTWDGYQYLAGNTGNVVSYGYNLDLGNFNDDPNLLASVGSYNGSDPVGLRSRELTGAKAGQIRLRLEEDRSLDNETNHTREEVNFFGIEGSGILTAQAYDPLASQMAEESMFISEPVDVI